MARESFGSRFGFIMTTAGFSVGLGNIWRFPYLTGENGGGVFVLTYLLICIFISIPLFIAEVAMGRKAQLNPVQGIRKLHHEKSPWGMTGDGSLSWFHRDKEPSPVMPRSNLL
ncbi:MAG: hypothetical protein AAGU27_06660 [Dehalobacterium sp.]